MEAITAAMPNRGDPARKPELLVLLHSLEDQTAMLASSIAQLEDRLHPVLETIDPSAPVACAKVNSPEPSRIPVASMLQARIEVLLDLRARVDSLLSRLGV